MSQSDDLQTRAALEAIGALSKRLTTIEAQTRADAARKPDDDDKRSAKPDDDDRKRDDAPVDMTEIATMLRVILKHLGEDGDEPEGEGDDDDDRRDDDARHSRLLRRIQNLADDIGAFRAGARRSDDEDDKVGMAQHRHDSVLQLHGVRADRPRVMETSAPYRLRLCKQAQRLLPVAHPLHRADFALIRDPVAFDQTEAQLLEAVKSAAYDPAFNVPPGQLREVVETDRAGRRISRWVGDVGVTFQPFRLPTYRAKINRPIGSVYNADPYHPAIDGKLVR